MNFEVMYLKLLNPKFEILSEVNGGEILRFLERIARTCYKSEDKITDESSEDFIRRIVDRGHEAMIEHVSVSVRLTIDRGVSHEVVRHRVASYAQESTRYCNYSKDKFGNEVSFIDISGGMNNDPKTNVLTREQFEAVYEEWLNACQDAEEHYFNLLELGASPQIARSVLNNSTKTEICVTMNLREWRHFFQLRTALAAHPQMREIAVPLLKAFKNEIPVIFDDIEVPVYG